MMIDWLEGIDKSLIIFVNSLHTPFLDEFFWIVSGKLIWIPFYIFILFLVAKAYNIKSMFIFLLTVIACVALADLSSVHLFKEVFLRYRPSHNLELTNQLHFYMYSNGDVYKGGTYGFVSSHAANFGAIMGLSFLTLRKKMPWTRLMFILVLLGVSFSRVYLGVHYVSDVLVGALLGFLIAYLLYVLIINPFVIKD